MLRLLQFKHFPADFNGFTRIEYLSIFLSLLFAFSVAEVMLGWSKMLKSKDKITFSLDHFLMTVALFWVLIINWYVLWGRVGVLGNGFGYFLISFLPIIIIYFWSLYLFPDLDEEKDLVVYIDKSYRIIFLLWSSFLAVNITISVLLDEIDISELTVLIRGIGITTMVITAAFSLRRWRRIAIIINLIILLVGTIHIAQNM
ncbi:MAG TPA: hypothetical protein VNB90_07535 [Cytophagaceae bacterium]|nr:hypothetical protein [Cytophagaceae bacterium]